MVFHCIRFLCLIAGIVLSAGSSFAFEKCVDDPGTWLEVDVRGFKDRLGDVAVEVHPDQEEGFMDVLVSRQRLKTPEKDPSVCVPLPGPGSYILVVLHDRNSNKKLNVFSDGFGFSRNPEIGMGLPARDEIFFEAAAGRNRQTVILNYVQGLTARPIDEEHQQKQSRRRRLR